MPGAVKFSHHVTVTLLELVTETLLKLNVDVEPPAWSEHCVIVLSCGTGVSIAIYCPGGKEKHFDEVAGHSNPEPVQKFVLPVPHPRNTSVSAMGVPQGQLNEF